MQNMRHNYLLVIHVVVDTGFVRNATIRPLCLYSFNLTIWTLYPESRSIALDSVRLTAPKNAPFNDVIFFSLLKQISKRPRPKFEKAFLGGYLQPALPPTIGQSGILGCYSFLFDTQTQTAAGFPLPHAFKVVLDLRQFNL
ncbi:MAG: hypothetical protein P8166_08340 [Candidatus Thiodiazotropha sp.]